MKLIFAIVQDEDGNDVIDELNQNGFRVTKMCSSGGFLKSGNTTVISGVEDEEVDKAIDLIKKKSKVRKQVLNSAVMPGSFNGSLYIPYPIDVIIGGATIFVINLERQVKITNSL